MFTGKAKGLPWKGASIGWVTVLLLMKVQNKLERLPLAILYTLRSMSWSQPNWSTMHGRLLALPVIIRLVCKILPRTNALAYFSLSSIMKKNLVPPLTKLAVMAIDSLASRLRRSKPSIGTWERIRKTVPLYCTLVLYPCTVLLYCKLVL